MDKDHFHMVKPVAEGKPRGGGAISPSRKQNRNYAPTKPHNSLFPIFIVFCRSYTIDPGLL